MPRSGDQPEPSILDARLAEIDRRLHSIQTGLVEEDPPAALPPRIAVPGDHPRPAAARGSGPSTVSGSGPSAALGPGEAQAAAEMLSRLCELVATQEGMLASMRELLAAAQRRADAARSPEAASAVGVRAGPFSSTEALRSFRAALEALPGVRAVELRGFEGADRAILDIHL
jgi:hypothetical protein